MVDASAEWPAPLQNFLLPLDAEFAMIMLWITVALTAISGLIYLWRNRALYMEDV